MNELDLKTKAGIQKFVVALVSIISTVLIGIFGWSPDRTNELTSALAPFIPVITAIIYFFVNQIAARGKAATEIKKLEILAQSGVLSNNAVASTPEVTTQHSNQIASTSYEPFNSEQFMDKVMSKVGQMYGEVNDSTIYYTALSTYRYDWDFKNIEQRKQAAELLLVLAKKAFKSIWGSSFDDELNRPIKPEDCTLKNMRERAIAKGMEYYTAYLQVIEAMKLQETLTE